MTPRLTAVAVVTCVLSAACGGGSTTSPGPPPPPTVTSVAVTGAAAAPGVGDTAQLSATAAFSDGTSQVVTLQATWQTSNATVATVSPSGLATFLAAGEAELRATFRSTIGTARVVVTARSPTRFQLNGTITERGGPKPVAGATVTVVDGPDAGRSAVTDASGVYSLANISMGSFNLRAARTDYETQTIPVSLTADSRVDFALNLLPPPPPPPPPPVDVSGFFGTYTVSLSVAQQSCEFPFTVGPTGTMNLNGRSDGSDLVVTIVERGTTRTYRGALRPDGTFDGIGGGVIAGFSQGPDRHDYSGDISGTVSGRAINATENVLFGQPCPGRTMRITYSGSR